MSFNRRSFLLALPGAALVGRLWPAEKTIKLMWGSSAVPMRPIINSGNLDAYIARMSMRANYVASCWVESAGMKPRTPFFPGVNPDIIRVRLSQSWRDALPPGDDTPTPEVADLSK